VSALRDPLGSPEVPSAGRGGRGGLNGWRPAPAITTIEKSEGDVVDESSTGDGDAVVEEASEGIWKLKQPGEL
jgi:hypothetical protein